MRAYGDGHYDISRRRCATVKTSRARARRQDDREVSDWLDGVVHPAEFRPLVCDASCGALCPLCQGD